MTPEQIEAMMRKAHPVDEVIIRNFIADYQSTCHTCWEEISPGDEAGYIGDDTEASCWECCKKEKDA